MTSLDVEYRVITISGDIATGTSTLATGLAKELGWERFNSGDFFRAWMPAHGFTLEQADKVPPEIDKQIDYGVQDQIKTATHKIFESRLAGWLAQDIEGVFKVLCLADPNECVKRFAFREQLSTEQAIKKMDERSKKLQQKFHDLYGIENCFDPQYFDLVVDTTTLTPEQVRESVLSKLV